MLFRSEPERPPAGAGHAGGSRRRVPAGDRRHGVERRQVGVVGARRVVAWSAFVLRTPMFGLGAARRAHRAAGWHPGGDQPPGQRPLPSDITITTPTTSASTSSATFHGLFGYSPSIVPVTPLITHWNAFAP